MQRLKLNPGIAEKILGELGDDGVRKALHKKGGNGFLKKGVCPPWLEATKWKPGVCVNPSGTFRKAKLSSEIDRHLAEIEPTTGLTYARLIAYAMIERAIRGDVIAAREIRECTEGKPKQSVQVTGQISHQNVEDLSIAELDAIIQDYLERFHGGKDEIQNASK